MGAGDKPYPKLFIQHIPKTGVTSIVEAIRIIYGEKNVQRLIIPNDSQWQIYLRDPKSKWHTDRDWFIDMAHGHLFAHSPYLDSVQVLHGHHPYYVIEPLLRETGRKLVTWVRDPISLAISWFSWDRSNSNLETPQTMKQYLEEGCRNNVLDQMLGWDVDYSFIGFNEWMKEDWTYFCSLFGFPAMELPRKNGQPFGYNTQIYLDPDMVKLIAKANSKDMSRYGDLVGQRFKKGGAVWLED